MVVAITRFRILKEARSWIGTPYRHQASVKGAGADCLGVLRGVYGALYGKEPEVPPPYRPDWYDAKKEDLLLEKAFQYLEKTDLELIGNVIVFRMASGMAAKHCAIISEEGRMIHARSGACVEEVTIGSWYRRRMVGLFQFPGAR